MIRNLLDKMIVKLTGGIDNSESMEIDYLSILNAVEPLTEDHSIYLETSDGEFIANGSCVGDKTIVSVCIAYVKEGVKPWDTEEPAKRMLHKVDDATAYKPLLLLSRNPIYFVGYYVQIKSA